MFDGCQTCDCETTEGDKYTLLALFWMAGILVLLREYLYVAGGWNTPRQIGCRRGSLETQQVSFGAG